MGSANRPPKGNWQCPSRSRTDSFIALLDGVTKSARCSSAIKSAGLFALPFSNAYHAVLLANRIALFKAHRLRLGEIESVRLPEKLLKAGFVEEVNDLHWPGVSHRHLVLAGRRHEDEITGSDGDVLLVDRGRARATDYIEEFICVRMGVKTRSKTGW